MMALRRSFREVGVPTILRSGPYRFHFYSHEHEPPHVHIASADGTAVVRLAPVVIKRAIGYTRRQVTEIEEMVIRHEAEFLRRWHDYFAR